jgi:adenylate kinase
LGSQPEMRCPTIRHLVVFGRPGSGKSSVADSLAAHARYRIVRTGELLREAVRRRDPLGLRVEGIVARGELVPDPLIFEVLEDAHFRPEEENLLFDGFPRTIGQVPDFDRLEDRFGFQVGLFVEIAVSESEAMERMTGRRVCPTCGKTYHLKNKPSRVEGHCDDDQTPLIRRADDTPEVVANRQRVYAELTQPVVDHYRATYPKRFREIDGGQSFDDVCNDLRKAVGLE